MEAGPGLSGALLSAGLVDEWLLYLAPKLLGPHAMPLASFPRLRELSAARGFSIVDAQNIGPDLRLRLRPANQEG